MTLIERIEHWKPGTPSRELDDEILLACGWTEWVQSEELRWLSPPQSTAMFLRGDPTCPSPLTSLDAGRDLTDWRIVDAREARTPLSAVIGLLSDYPPAHLYVSGQHKISLRAAMVIAALRAREVGLREEETK